MKRYLCKTLAILLVLFCFYSVNAGGLLHKTALADGTLNLTEGEDNHPVLVTDTHLDNPSLDFESTAMSEVTKTFTVTNDGEDSFTFQSATAGGLGFETAYTADTVVAAGDKVTFTVTYKPISTSIVDDGSLYIRTTHGNFTYNLYGHDRSAITIRKTNGDLYDCIVPGSDPDQNKGTAFGSCPAAPADGKTTYFLISNFSDTDTHLTSIEVLNDSGETDTNFTVQYTAGTLLHANSIRNYTVTSPGGEILEYAAYQISIKFSPSDYGVLHHATVHVLTENGFDYTFGVSGTGTNSDGTISSFSFPTLESLPHYNVSISKASGQGQLVLVTVPYGTDITSLTPVITTHDPDASVTSVLIASDVFDESTWVTADPTKAVDFTKPVVQYTVLAPDGLTKYYYNVAITTYEPRAMVLDPSGYINIQNKDTTPSDTDGTSFGTLALDGTPIDSTFYLLNYGISDLKDSAITISDTSNFSVSFTSATLASCLITPETYLNFTITFHPVTSGLHSATVSIASNDPSSPYTFTVSGTGGPSSYTVAYNGNGATGGSTASSSHTYDVSKALTTNGFTRTGYHFTGWAESNTGAVKYTNGQSVKNLTLTNNGTFTLYAVWAANTYTVAYNGNGATGGSTANSGHTYDTAKALTANGFTKTGYHFTGWATSATGAVVYANSQSVKNLSAANGATVNLYAVWAVNTYTVAYNGNGATSGSTASSVHTYDAAKALTANGFTRTGYHFTGWAESATGTAKYTDGQSVKNLTATNGATVNLYAIWAANTYTVAYNGNGATGGSTASGSHIYDAAKALTANGFTRTGYHFTGWAESATGTVKYTDGQSVKNLTATNGATINLYAIWTANTYTVAYNGNGATGGSTASSIHTYDTAKALTANGFTRTGYHFTGWATSATGAVVYANSQTVKNLTATNGAIVNLYAIWAVNTYTVAYNGNGATGGSTASSAHTYNIAKALTANGFTKAGYVFAGWSTSATGAVVYTNSQIVKNLTPANGVTIPLYAVWAPAAPGTVNAASASFSSVKISWAAVTGAVGYEVSRSVSATGVFSPVTSTTGTSFVNTSLTTGTVYYYRVRAYRLSGQNKIYGSYSAVVSAKPVPAAPAGITAVSASSTSIKVSWSPVAGADGYQVYWSTSATGKFIPAASPVTATYTNLGLKTGTVYYYMVRAYKTVNSIQVFGSWSAVVSAKP